jgi:hypothetical protein
MLVGLLFVCVVPQPLVRFGFGWIIGSVFCIVRCAL